MNSSKIALILMIFNLTESATVDDVIQVCLFKILRKYFLKQPVLLIADLTIFREPFRKSLLPPLDKEYHREIIGNIMQKKKWTLEVYNTDKFVGLPVRFKLTRLKNAFVFIRAEIMASETLFAWEMDRLHKNPLWSPNGRTLVVIRSGRNDSAELARKVIEKLWTKSRSVHNLVMVAEENGEIHFYTWFPYRQPDCSRVKRVARLDTFQGGRFHRKADLFPEKIRTDLEGCELVAATETCIPYVFADPNNSSKFVDGLEVNLVNTLSAMLNFTLRTVRPTNMWTTSVNKTLVGAFKLLVEQKVDMAFSCLMLNRERYFLALALPSYYEDSLVWFVPSPTFTSHSEDIFYAFPLNFWLLMILVMIASVILVFLFTFMEHDAWGKGVGYVFRLLGISVNAPTGIPTKKSSFRFLIFLFCIYSLHITVAFQSSLFALYQRPHYDRFYSSLEQAVDDGLLIYLRESTQDLYNQSNHALWEKILRPGHFDYLKDFGEAFSEIAYDKTAVALFIKTTGIYMISVYFTDEFGTSQIFWLKQEFAPYPVTTYLSPGNPLYRIFESRVHRLVASGLIRIWLRRSVLAGKLTLMSEEYENSPLNMKHVGGAFFLLLLLLSAAALVFLGEIFAFRFLKGSKKKKRDHRHFYQPPKSKLKSVTIARIDNVGQIFLE